MISWAMGSFSPDLKGAANVCDSIAGKPIARTRRRDLAEVEAAQQTEKAGVAGVQNVQQSEAAASFLEAYGRMYLIRLFENAIHRLFLAGEVHGTTHLCAGQEAVAVGVCLA